jgi:hypothetical protein
MEMKSYLSENKLILHKKIFLIVWKYSEKMENKRWKIYCFFTTDTNNNKIVLICTKNNQ